MAPLVPARQETLVQRPVLERAQGEVRQEKQPKKRGLRPGEGQALSLERQEASIHIAGTLGQPA